MSTNILTITWLDALLQSGHLHWAGTLATVSAARTLQQDVLMQGSIGGLSDHLLRDIGIEPHLVKDEEWLQPAANIRRI